MSEYLTSRAAGAIPVIPLDSETLASWLGGQSASVSQWVGANGFTASGGTICPVPGGDGGLAMVLYGCPDEGGPWSWAGLPTLLAAGVYRVSGDLDAELADDIALGWMLGAYRFDRYRTDERTIATLVWPDGCDQDRMTAAADAVFLARDLINTPAEDMGPHHLAEVAGDLAARYRADFTVIEGEDLLAANYPAIHAVGRASDRAPRLIDLSWGKEDAPKVTLVGKGVCFDTGGLDLKPSANMKLMKKDMGGAANILGLAGMIMGAGLGVRLRVLIPAVENSVSASALRPLDVVATRKGLTVEIGNTDAEGRVILADVLAEAASQSPDLLIDMATLTGAARAALGTGLPALFCNDDETADAILAEGVRTHDPLWRLPLWAPYGELIESKVADLTNAPDNGFGGAITAALFLERFVNGPGHWVHIDLMAWNTRPRPGRPEGGEAQGIRALFAYIEARFGS